MADDKFPFVHNASVELPSNAFAEIVKTATGVDPELRSEEVQRELWVEGCTFHMRFRAKNERSLRTSANSFQEFVKVSIAALEEFGEKDAAKQKA